MQKRIKLLLPPGVGDAYWSLVKTESLLKREGITPPVDAYVAAPRVKKYNSHARVFPFLEMFPFLHSTGELRFTKGDPIWREAYLQQKRSVFRNIQGCDYFITWNGYLRAGKSLEEIDPDLKCNWFLPRIISQREEDYREKSIAQYGKYLVLYWVFQGTNKLMLKHFSIEQIAAALNEIIKKTKLTPVLVGAIWDLDDQRLEELKSLLPKKLIDLRGKTNLEEIFGLMRGSQGVVGMNSGITIMSAVFGIKTILLYHEYFTKNGVHRDFAWNTFPPAVRRKTYFAEYAEDITEKEFANRVISVINNTAYPPKKKGVPVRKKSKKHNQDIGPVDMPVYPRMNPESHSSIRDIVLEESQVPDQKIVVACVLKKGGPYTKQYVDRLYQGIKEHTTINFRFVGLSDMIKGNSKYEVIPLLHGWSGWWSKMEIFRPGIFNGSRVIYFDLDTMIVGNIDTLLQYPHQFTMLRPFNPSRYDSFTSGVMAWSDDMSCIYDQFKAMHPKPFNDRTGDRRYILEFCNTRPEYINNIQPGIYSYKWHCKSKVPKDATIVCFHGHPRPHEIGWNI